MALQALPHCWVHSAGVSGGVKIYSGTTIIMEIYSALSLAIGRQDGMDGGGGQWMMCSNYRNIIHYGASSLLGASGRGFGWGKMSLGSISLVTIYSTI